LWRRKKEEKQTRLVSIEWSRKRKLERRLGDKNGGWTQKERGADERVIEKKGGASAIDNRWWWRDRKAENSYAR